jgi:hypothetical protein
LEVQLNVDADKYAGDFQLANGTFRPIVSLLPSCDAMLSIRGISVTSNYRKQLIRAFVEPEFSKRHKRCIAEEDNKSNNILIDKLLIQMSLLVLY